MNKKEIELVKKLITEHLDHLVSEGLICSTCGGGTKFLKNGKLADGRCTYDYCGDCHVEIRTTKLHEDMRKDLKELMK